MVFAAVLVLGLWEKRREEKRESFETAYDEFRGEALRRDAPHLSDCALNNEPAMRARPCDCLSRRA